VVTRLVVASPGEAVAKLSRGKKLVAKRTFKLRNGTNTLPLRVPRGLKPGWSRLVVTVRNPSGRAQVLSMRVRLPKGRG
jgi:hypothetical protein